MLETDGDEVVVDEVGDDEIGADELDVDTCAEVAVGGETSKHVIAIGKVETPYPAAR